MAGDKTYIEDDLGKQHRATRTKAVTPESIVWSNNPNDYTVQVRIAGKWHRAILTYDVQDATFFDNINIDKALVTGGDGKTHTALIVSPEASEVIMSSIPTDEHSIIEGTTTGETVVNTYSENWSNVVWQDNVNVYKVLVEGSDGKKHTALLTTKGGGGSVEVIVRGAEYIALPDAIADSLAYLKAFGGTEQRNLPDNYIERQFIYMMDGSYLLTDIVPTYDGRIEMDFQTTSVPSGSLYLLGGRTVTYGGLFFLQGNNGVCVVDAFGTEVGNRYTSNVSLSNNTRYKFTFNNKVATLASGGTTLFTNTFTGENANGAALVINGLNSNGTVTSTQAGIYLYSFKVWNAQGELVADYVPAVEKAAVPVVGFYDTVSGTFKTATAGTFAAGGEAVPTPDTPMDIVSNNGVVKVSPNLFDKEQTYIPAYVHSQTGVLTDASGRQRSFVVGCLPNTTYTLSGMTAASGWGSFTSSAIGTTATSFTAGNGTITTGANDKYLIGMAYVESSSTYDYRDTLQIEQGSVATPYYPYGQIYADGTVETINVHGKNLFDKSAATRGFYISENGSIAASANWSVSDYIPVVAGQIITISGITFSSSAARFNFYNSNKERIETVSYGNVTLTPPNNASYIRICYRWVDDENTVQLERGSTATPYEPYFNGGTATAEMLLKVDDYEDVQEILSGAITRNIGVKVLDGTEDWQVINTPYFSLAKSDITPSTLSGDGFNSICSHFARVQRGTELPTKVCFYWGKSYLNINIDVSGSTTLAQFKQYLADQYAAGTPVIVIYPLATPTTESVAGQAMQVQQGDNVVEITQAALSNLELEAKYQAAVSLTIQEVQDANLDPNVQVTIN